MPTYEYRCKDCGQHLEVVQSFQDDALTECPGCGGELRKVFGSIGITFKGSGFYRTDNRAGGSARHPESGKETGKEATKESASADGGSKSSSGSSSSSESTSSSSSSSGSSSPSSTPSSSSSSASAAAAS